jgi:hypothetical protein
MKLQTVTGETIKLSKWGCYSLNYVIECGRDWVGDVSICDGAVAANHRKARVFVSENPGVKNLMELAYSRNELVIKTV